MTEGARMTVASTASTSATASSAASGTALGSLSGNFNDFLKLLMTQLENQDPTSPMDANQFTAQLVQFASVEQQINTNTNLTTLIQATQAGNLAQASALVGSQVQVQSSQLSLQNGAAALSFAATQPATVTVTSPSGTVLKTATVAAGSTGWSWDGTSNAGTGQADGAYGVSVKTADGTDVPFTVRGTVTAATRGASGATLSLGPLNVDYTMLASVVK